LALRSETRAAYRGDDFGQAVAVAGPACDPGLNAIEPETGLITAALLTPGTGAEHHEATVALELLADEPEGLQIFGDTAYASDACCGALTRAGHELFIKPQPLKTAVPGGFSLDDFAIDTTAGTVTCPAGHQVVLAGPSGMHQQRIAAFTGLCTACPLRSRCTKAKTGRTITIRPHHDQQAAARYRAATDPDWQAAYRRWRPPVERVISWITGGGNRRLRYRGAIKNDAWLNTRAAALNLRTLINLGLHHTSQGWALAQA
jgi:hypothetical protein